MPGNQIIPAFHNFVVFDFYTSHSNVNLKVGDFKEISGYEYGYING